MPERLVCTIITKSYLADARTLAQTVAEHNPGLRLLVLLADRIDGHFDPANEPFTLIELDDLPDSAAAHRMSFYYTAFELCCALRGLLHRYVLEKTDAEAWLFLDSDVMVCGSLDVVFERLRSHSILLSPHRGAAAPERMIDLELLILQIGVFNGGFLGCRRTEETRRFSLWFADRLERYAFDDPHGRHQFVDQLWLNLVPLYFPNARILMHPGVNLGHWNLDHNAIAVSSTTGTGGEHSFTVNGEDLLFIHFSGWQIECPEEISKLSPHFAGPGSEAWRVLGQLYRRKLLANGFHVARKLPYAFNRFDDGGSITRDMRRLYFRDLATNSDRPEGFGDPPFHRGREYRRRARMALMLGVGRRLYFEPYRMIKRLFKSK